MGVIDSVRNRIVRWLFPNVVMRNRICLCGCFILASSGSAASKNSEWKSVEMVPVKLVAGDLSKRTSADLQSIISDGKEMNASVWNCS